MTIAPFFRALPLVLPLLVVSVIFALLVGGRLARRWEIPGAVASVYLTAVGAFMAVTMTPTGTALEGMPSGSTYISLDLMMPDLRSLVSLNSDSLNVLVGIVLGGCAALLLLSRPTRPTGLVVIALLPPVSELVQWAVPALGRSGFLLTDVVLVWLGQLLGFLLAWLTVKAVHVLARQ